MSKKEVKKIIIKILKEWEWKSENSTYSELADFIIDDITEYEKKD